MSMSRREFIKDGAFAAALLAFPQWLTDSRVVSPPSDLSLPTHIQPELWSPASTADPVDPPVTALNRIAFGPRPLDVARVEQMGIDAFIDEQLHPEAIDDSVLEQRLQKDYPTLQQDAGELLQNFPQQRVVVPGSRLDRLLQLLNGLGLVEVKPGPLEIVSQLQQAVLLRAIFSKRQLLETLVDFWSTHFNIYVLKDEDRWLKTVDDREVIRKYALGNFGDLLHASASSPAMLEYLDNRLNVKGAPNENYAREIMELHTLGVNGGYTQTDVQELARCLTGWTIRPPRRDAFGGAVYADAGTFFFDANRHDDGSKRVLGQDIPSGGGIKDAQRVIDLLAHHPSTATFISRKLVLRYVSDNPPEPLVQRAAQTFVQTKGDIRATLATILHSDEFKDSFAQKVKRPFELVVSAVRALDMQLDDAGALATALRLMGQGPFMHLTPEGYPDKGPAWINTSGLLLRWNFAILAATNRIPRVHVDLVSQMPAGLKDAGSVFDFWVDYVLHHEIPDADRQKLIATVINAKDNSSFDPGKLSALVALLLASPHFQFR